jgi:hypothetical protein
VERHGFFGLKKSKSVDTFYTSDKPIEIDFSRHLGFTSMADHSPIHRVEILDTVARGDFMATGPAKIIDNSIIGFRRFHPNRNTELRSAGFVI